MNVRADDYKNQVYRRYLQILSKPAPYTFNNPRIQYFSLPFHVILHILHQKRSPFILLKLYQSCKYFFKKLAVLPIDNCQCYETLVFRKYSVWEKPATYELSKKVLFWFYNELAISHNCNSTLLRIHSCTVRILNIDSILAFNEFTLIARDSMIEEFYSSGEFVYPNGSTVPLNFILQYLSHCVIFTYRNKNELYSEKALLAMNELTFVNKFTRFAVCLTFISNDLFLLLKFMKKNCALDSFMAISLFAVKHENLAKIVADVRAAYKLVFADWKGKEPRILSKIK